MDVWRRFALIAAATCAAVLGLPAGAASAHAPAPDSVYYRAELTSVTPAEPGITVRVDQFGDWIELTNTTVGTVIVYGYTGEPYLRITRDSAAENRLSETTYLNRSLFASLPTTGPAATDPPQWAVIAATGTARWHDHRIHWMGNGRPAAVARDPAHPHVVGDWTVQAALDGHPFTIRGSLRWIGVVSSPSPLLWVVIAAANLPLILGAFLWSAARRRRGRAARAWRVADGGTA